MGLFSKKNRKINRSGKWKTVLFSIISLFSIGVILTVSGTKGWLSQNKAVVTDDVSLRVKMTRLTGFYLDENGTPVALGNGVDTVLPSSGGDFTFPGSSLTFDIGLMNLSRYAISSLGVRLEKPTVWTGTSATYPASGNGYDEVPILYDSSLYYFGSTVTANITSYTIYSNASKSGTTISISSGTEYSNTMTPLTLLSDPSSPEELELIDFGEMTLASGTALVIHLVLTFENDEENAQNQFRHFGEGIEKLTRSLKFDYSDET